MVVHLYKYSFIYLLIYYTEASHITQTNYNQDTNTKQIAIQ